MNEPETLKQALDAVASHPTVANSVAGALGTAGIAAILSQTQTVLGIVSLAIGCVVGLLVIRCNYLKSKLLQREWDNGSISQKELT